MEIPQLVYYTVAVVSTAGSAIAGVFAWHATRAVKNANVAAAAAQVGPLMKRVDDLEREAALARERLREAEKRIAAAPTEKMFADIHTLLERLDGKINVVGVRTESAAKAADRAMEACNRIEEFFVEKGIKS